MPVPTEVFQIKSATANKTGAATNESIIAAVTGKRITVTKLIFSSSGATDLVIEDATTKIYKLLNIDQHILDAERFKKIQTGVAAALTYTTTANNSEVYVEYYEAPA